MYQIIYCPIAEGQLFLIFVSPQLPFPPDGIRYQEQEQRYVLPVGNGMVRIEIKYFHGYWKPSELPDDLGVGGHGSEVWFHSWGGLYHRIPRAQKVSPAKRWASPTRPYPLFPGAKHA